MSDSAHHSRAASSADSTDKGSSVQVIVRCRPPSEKEKASNDAMVVGVSQQNHEVRILTNCKKGAAVKPDAATKVYTFDQAYGALSTQEEVYSNAVKPLVEEVLAGFNCTVFAYGQTGTGKTYTMEGQLSSSVSEHSGVIPRAIHTIFDQLAAKSFEDFSVKVSFLELYNEELSDLLCEVEEKPAPSGMGSMSSRIGSNNNNGDDEGRKELRIFEDPSGKKGMMVHNLEEVLVTSASQVFSLLQKANKNRKVAETNLNKNSSRSHYVFTITVHTKEYSEDGEDIIKTGKLYLVDLAGSECIGKSGAREQRAKEAGKINQSLLTLGRVINALVDRASFIPYRDSKLTRLLQESLGGRAKTVIIATVSPSSAAFDETLSTLDYAHRAKSIKNKPQCNQKMTKRAYMKELLMEIASLKRENECLRTKNGIIIPPEKYEAMIAEEKGKGLQIEELLFKIKNMQGSVDTLTTTLSEREEALQKTLVERDDLQTSLTQTVELLESTRTTLALCRGQLRKREALIGQYQLAHAEQSSFLDSHAQSLGGIRSSMDADAAARKEAIEATSHMIDSYQSTQDAAIIAALDAAKNDMAEAQQHRQSAHATQIQSLKESHATNKEKLDSKIIETQEFTKSQINAITESTKQQTIDMKDASMQQMNSAKDGTKQQMDAGQHAIIEQMTAMKQQATEAQHQLGSIEEASLKRMSALQQAMTEQMTAMQEATIKQMAALQQTFIQQMTALQEAHMQRMTSLREETTQQMAVMKQTQMKQSTMLTDMQDAFTQHMTTLQDGTMQRFTSMHDSMVQQLDSKESDRIQQLSEFESASLHQFDATKFLIQSHADEFAQHLASHESDFIQHEQSQSAMLEERASKRTADLQQSHAAGLATIKDHISEQLLARDAAMHAQRGAQVGAKEQEVQAFAAEAEKKRNEAEIEHGVDEADLQQLDDVEIDATIAASNEIDCNEPSSASVAASVAPSGRTSPAITTQVDESDDGGVEEEDAENLQPPPVNIAAVAPADIADKPVATTAAAPTHTHRRQPSASRIAAPKVLTAIPSAAATLNKTNAASLSKITPRFGAIPAAPKDA